MSNLLVASPVEIDDIRRTRWAITLAASLGWFFDAYVITIYALTIPFIAKELQVSTLVLSGEVGSIFLVGYTIGTIGFGTVGDVLGRKTMLGISIIGYGIITALTGFATSLLALALLRFLTGVAGGGELSIGAPYVSEVWDRKSRSTGIGIMYSFYPLGFVFAVLAFSVITPILGWRAVYFFALVPAALILFLRLRLEESPRFQNVLAQIESGHKQRVGLLKALGNPVFRYRILVGSLIFMSLTYGYFAMVFYIPSFVIHQYNLSPTVGAAAVTSLLQVSGIVGGLSGGFIGDRLGRRWPAMILAALGIVTIYLWWGLHWSLPGFCIMVFIGGFIVAYEWAVGIVYVSEIFPTEVRASGFGWSAGLGRTVSIAAPIMTQFLAGKFGVGVAIQLSSAIWLCLIIGYAISHETHGSELADRVEQMRHKQC
ncbi:MFS transporter [Acidiphilium multivorum]|uniref:MFS transporter n=1 Tax=Acidiphilium multivorum TaxID=62140 RepID=UPI001F4C34F2|nr:MFS transporter [Acidiphilium multivorum]UNC13941.1 MFS transporter [Acidiphilium multivorum]